MTCEASCEVFSCIMLCYALCGIVHNPSVTQLFPGQSSPPTSPPPPLHPRERRCGALYPTGRLLGWALWRQKWAWSQAPGASRWDHGKHVCAVGVHTGSWLLTSVLGGWLSPQLSCCCCCCYWVGVEKPPSVFLSVWILRIYTPVFGGFLCFCTCQSNRTS